MSRCRICDEVMEVFEMKKKKSNGDWEDTCSSCLSDLHFFETTEETFRFYQHEGGRTGLKLTKYRD